MVSLFGTNDKTALTVVVVAAVLLVGVLRRAASPGASRRSRSR